MNVDTIYEIRARDIQKRKVCNQSMPMSGIMQSDINMFAKWFRSTTGYSYTSDPQILYYFQHFPYLNSPIVLWSQIILRVRFIDESKKSKSIDSYSLLPEESNVVLISINAFTGENEYVPIQHCN